MPQNNFLDQFVSTLQTEIDFEEEAPPSVGHWALREKIILDTGPFSFKKHEYLEEPYKDNHPCQVEMKAAQMGNTTRAMLRLFFVAMFKPIVGILYLFPSKTGSGEFSSSRIGPLVARNPESIGRFLKGTDSVALKRVKGKNLIFRGTKSTEGLRSDPVDMVVYDEFELFPDGIDKVANERMSHSEFKFMHYLSNPGMPDDGIDEIFQLTDQRYWLLKCPKCGEWTCLEDTMDKTGKEPPACLVQLNGKVVRLCMHCRDQALDPARGQWVAKKPSITDMRGYHYSQLFSQYIDPAVILNEVQTSNNLGATYNYKLGMPFVEAENRLSREEVLSLCGNAGIAPSDQGPCYMGVDQRDRERHVVIGKRHPDRIVHIGKYGSWEDIPPLMKRFNVALAVIDAQPETDSARKIANQFPGRVYLCFYSQHQKGAWVWSEARYQVTVNRTESMDQSHKQIQDGGIALPKDCGVLQEFATHCHNVAKKLEEKDDGSSRYVYTRLGTDHFRHAMNYECIARSKGAGSFFAGCDLS